MSKNSLHKICLGSAQFGMDYGINNKRGKIHQAEVFKILDKAIKLGVDTIDTASVYGQSEKVLGNFIRTYPVKLRIISKLHKCEYGEVREILESSLSNLGVDRIYGYLIHAFENYKKDKKIWNELEKLKSEGKIEKIGFSLYHPFELESVLEDDLKIDMIQFPFSVFDRRFEPYLAKLKDRKMEIYTRSIFLQGLAFKKPDELDAYFETIKDKIKKINLLSEEFVIPISALCLNFVLSNPLVDYVVVGVDNLLQFDELMQAPAYLSKVHNIITQLYDLRVNDEKIILPFNWSFKIGLAQ